MRIIVRFGIANQPKRRSRRLISDMSEASLARRGGVEASVARRMAVIMSDGAPIGHCSGWRHRDRSRRVGSVRCASAPPIIKPSMSVIEIRGLSKSYRVYQKKEGLGASLRGLFHREYRDVHAVRGIDLDVEKGEFVAFLGPNGAGKTTTLKLLSGVITPTAGEARVLGFVPWERDNDYRRRFALVMGQKNQLWWDLPAQESFRAAPEDLPHRPRGVRRRRKTSWSTCSASASCSASRCASCRSASG